MAIMSGDEVYARQTITLDDEISSNRIARSASQVQYVSATRQQSEKFDQPSFFEKALASFPAPSGVA
jgi:hypothetical protein